MNNRRRNYVREARNEKRVNENVVLGARGNSGVTENSKEILIRKVCVSPQQMAVIDNK